jgi:hypothetical protein
MKITVALMRDLDKQVEREEISYSRMVEILNETANKPEAMLCGKGETDIWEELMQDWCEASVSDEVGKTVLDYLKSKYNLTRK